MVKTEKGEADERWFTVGDDATQATSEAAMRAALIVQRDRLAGIDVDVVSDEEWPAAVAAEVRRAERRPLSGHHLRQRDLSYDVVQGTAPAAKRWRPPEGWRAYEQTVRLGSGADVWTEASTAVLSWGVKTRSGFTVDPPLAPGRVARPGERYWLVAHIGPARVREPVVIVDTVDTPDRVALAYGTLDGHPVAGEESFIVHRDHRGKVSLTLRSLTRAGRGRWRLFFPVILVAQSVYRRRYLRALARRRR